MRPRRRGGARERVGLAADQRRVMLSCARARLLHGLFQQRNLPGSVFRENAQNLSKGILISNHTGQGHRSVKNVFLTAGSCR